MARMARHFSSPYGGPLKTARGAYPPVALAEIYQEYKSPLTKIRRLHLMVVDLGRSRSVSPQVYQDFMNCRVSLDPAGSLNTLPVPISGKDCSFKTRYVFAYGVDNSDRPSYLLWPIRGGNGQFLLVDPWSGNYFDLEAAKFMVSPVKPPTKRAKMILQMCLIWKNSTKRILTSVLLRGVDAGTGWLR